MAKNLFGKSRDKSNPYVKLEYAGWCWSILKLYRAPAASLADKYARGFCFVTSPMCLDGEYGDTYLAEIPGAHGWLAAEAAKAA